VRLAAGAVVGLGGKLGIEVEMGLVDGFEFVGYILNSFDYHYVMEIAPEAFNALIRIAVARMTDVEEIAVFSAAKGKALVKEAFNWGKQRGLDIKKGMTSAISGGQKEKIIQSSVPEASGAIILGIMEIPQESDFDAILKILRPAKKHELKSILRVVSEMQYSRSMNFVEMQGKALQEGIRRLMEFGGYFDEEKGLRKNVYILEIQKVLKSNGINHEFK
jgi:hypothetical protein